MFNQKYSEHLKPDNQFSHLSFFYCYKHRFSIQEGICTALNIHWLLHSLISCGNQKTKVQWAPNKRFKLGSISFRFKWDMMNKNLQQRKSYKVEHHYSQCTLLSMQYAEFYHSSTCFCRLIIAPRLGLFETRHLFSQVRSNIFFRRLCSWFSRRMFYQHQDGYFLVTYTASNKFIIFMGIIYFPLSGLRCSFRMAFSNVKFF